MMDSRSRRLPFSVSGSRSSYTSPSSFSSSSSSSLGSSRLYGRDRVLSSDCFPRTSSALKPDLDHQSSRRLSSPRDYSSSDSRSTSWKLPSSLTSSTSSYDRPWTDSALSSRSKLSDSERRLGTYSGLLNASDDGDSKRAKLSCSNRGAYSRTSSTSVTGSTYSSNGLGSGTGMHQYRYLGQYSPKSTGEKQSDTWLDSSWSSCRLLSRSSSSSSSTSSSKPLLSRRELETRHESSLSGLGESRIRTPGLSSSLYQPDRVTSTYAQGARPKETVYSSTSSSSSSTARESSLSRHLSSASSFYRSSPSARDFSTRTTARTLTSSSNHSSQEQTANPESVSVISSSTSHISYWYTPPAARQDTNPPPSPAAPVPPAPRPAPESGEPDGRRSTRRLFSRLFSRRSSQDSSSGSSSTRSFESTDDSPPTGGEAVDSEEGARTSSVEPDIRSSDTAQAFAFLRRRRLDLSPIQETRSESHRVGPARSSLDAWREPGSSSSNNSSSGSGGGSSWLSSSLRNRCPPLFSRHRREGRDESTHSAAGLEDGYSHPQHSLRRWDEPEHKASEEEDEEEEEDDGEAVGAVGVEVPGAAGASTILVERMQGTFGNERIAFSAPPRVRLYENILVAVDPMDGVESQPEGREKEKPIPSRDPERLRKIQESLLLEDSDEEEGDLCRICQMGEELASNPLIEPCSCTGSLQYVHQECIKKWLRSKISSGTDLEAITTCELCKEKLHLNIDNFDINELYRTHVQSEYEFISSGLYLVVLLHLCEQRFSDVLGAANEAGFFNLARTLHEHMDNLESPHGETDEEEDEVVVRDSRPSIEFSDLDDDLEEEY
uniref:E3 ubiquitin-protein ligase MARCHF7 isoform X1 n=1 Tax=Centroberyx gerrardi TaxID=166262 RepID=UPI003AAE08A5